MLSLVAPLPSKSYAPELYALADYCAGRSDVRLSLVKEDGLPESATKADGIYLKMGFAPAWRSFGKPEVHDYSSLSTGQHRRLKDFFKRRASRRPQLRSFLSDDVRRGFAFRDGVNYVLRDMGVPGEFLKHRERSHGSHIDHDLFYAGSITPSRGTADLFAAVDAAGMSLLAVGTPSDGIYAEFKDSRAITFTGKVPLSEVPDLAARARAGVNYTPNVYPYNVQTSTKVLEYLALGLPVVTNDYNWVRSFEIESGAQFCRLRTIEQLTRDVLDHDFEVPDMRSYTWDRVFERSGIVTAVVNAFS